MPKQPTTVNRPILDEEKIISIVQNWFAEAHPQTRQIFVDTQENDLASYHSSLGRAIRNEFKMWEHSWNPELIEDIDCSPDHPDAISMRIIKEVWRREQRKK